MLFVSEFQNLSKRTRFEVQKNQNKPIFFSKVKKMLNLQIREENKANLSKKTAPKTPHDAMCCAQI